MFLRKFTNSGIDEFRKQLYELKSGTRTDLDKSILTNDNFTIHFEKNIEIEFSTFIDKESITKYLVEKFELRQNRKLYYDVGLWTWLSAFFFDLVCPKNLKGERSVKAEARYILADPKNWKRYYRHLLACPARLYCDLDELAKPFLASPVNIWGDFHEQLTAYQDIAANKSLIETAGAMYWDKNQNKLKKGSGSKGPGSPRRFSDIVGQFELTYDLNAMSSSSIISLFPKREFGRWTSIN